MLLTPQRGLPKPDGVVLLNPRLPAELALLLAENRSGGVVDYSSRRRALTWNGSLARSVKPNHGRVLTFNGSDTYLRYSGNLTGTRAAFSYIAVFRTTMTTAGRFWYENDDVTDRYHLFTVMENDAGGTGELAFGINRDDAHTGWVLSATGVLNGIINDGKRHVAIATQRATNDREIFFDGKSYGTNTSNVTGTFTADHGDVGRQQNSTFTGTYFNGDLEAFLILPVGITPAYAKVISSQFWRKMAPRRRLFVLTPPAAAKTPYFPTRLSAPVMAQ